MVLPHGTITLATAWAVEICTSSSTQQFLQFCNFLNQQLFLFSRNNNLWHFRYLLSVFHNKRNKKSRRFSIAVRSVAVIGQYRKKTVNTYRATTWTVISPGSWFYTRARKVRSPPTMNNPWVNSGKKKNRKSPGNLASKRHRLNHLHH